MAMLRCRRSGIYGWQRDQDGPALIRRRVGYESVAESGSNHLVGSTSVPGLAARPATRLSAGDSSLRVIGINLLRFDILQFNF
jgi:hypothetical protein